MKKHEPDREIKHDKAVNNLDTNYDRKSKNQLRDYFLKTVFVVLSIAIIIFAIIGIRSTLFKEENQIAESQNDRQTDTSVLISSGLYDYIQSGFERVDIDKKNVDEAEKSYNLSLSTEDKEIKKYYLLNAYYHDPNRIEYASDYYSLLDTVDDSYQVNMLLELLSSAVYQVDSEHVVATINLIDSINDELQTNNEISYPDSIINISIDYSAKYDSLWTELNEIINRNDSLTDTQFESLFEEKLNSLCDCFNSIDEPSDSQLIRNQSCLVALEICSLLKSSISIKQTLFLNDSAMLAYISTYPYIEQLVFALESTSIDNNLFVLCVDLKDRGLNTCLELIEYGEKQIVSHLESEIGSLINRKPSSTYYSKTRFDSYYDSIISLGNTIPQYSNYGINNSFFVNLESLNEKLANEITWVTGIRYMEYQKWAASVMSKCDSILKGKGSDENKLSEMNVAGYFCIEPTLLTYQLKSWFDSIDVSSLSKKQGDLFLELSSSATKKTIEDF